MKRISLFYVALVAVLFLACKQATPGDKMVELCNEYAEKLDKAQSSSQVDSLRALVDKGIEDILNTVPSDYEPTDEENVAVDEAMNKLQKALGVADEKFTAADEPDQQPAQEEKPNHWLKPTQSRASEVICQKSRQSRKKMPELSVK